MFRATVTQSIITQLPAWEVFKLCKQSGKTHWYGNAKLLYVMFCHYGVKERNSLSWSMGKKGKSVTRRWAGFKRKEDKPRTEGTDYPLHSHLRTKANNIQHNSNSPRFCGGEGVDFVWFFFFFTFVISESWSDRWMPSINMPAPRMLGGNCAKSSRTVLCPGTCAEEGDSSCDNHPEGAGPTTAGGRGSDSASPRWRAPLGLDSHTGFCRERWAGEHSHGERSME